MRLMMVFDKMLGLATLLKMPLIDFRRQSVRGFNSPADSEGFMMNRTQKVCANGRYLWERSIGGTREAPTREPPVIVKDAMAAIRDELLFVWDWTGDASIPEPAKIGETLLSQWVSATDTKTGQLAAVLTFRKAKRGESRLPVAIIFDATKGAVTTASVEEYEATRTQAA